MIRVPNEPVLQVAATRGQYCLTTSYLPLRRTTFWREQCTHTFIDTADALECNRTSPLSAAGCSQSSGSHRHFPVAGRNGFRWQSSSLARERIVGHRNNRTSVSRIAPASAPTDLLLGPLDDGKRISGSSGQIRILLAKTALRAEHVHHDVGLGSGIGFRSRRAILDGLCLGG